MQDKSIFRKTGLKIERKYTRSIKQDVYRDIEFAERESRISEHSGKSVASIRITAPTNWSQTAVDIMAHKYLRKSGVPKILKTVPEDGVPEWLWRSAEDSEKLYGVDDRYHGENDVRQVVHRLAGAWTYWGWNARYFDSEDDARAFYDELCYILITQRAAPNSPQFFNTGIHWAYGIEGSSQGHYYFDELLRKVVQSKNAYERPQVHACFIQSVDDDLINEGGIFDLGLREARVFKYGSGSGTNFSNLRSKTESLSGGGKSSGLMSFLKLFNVIGGVIKSGGTTRRAAKMVVLDADHPEIMDFIDWKVREENKVVSMVAGSRNVKDFLDSVLEVYRETKNTDLTTNRRLYEIVQAAHENEIPGAYIERVLSLLRQGVTEHAWEVMNTDYTGTAYESVDGQNSNNSVRLSNDFFNTLLQDGDYHLKYRTTGKIAQTLPAQHIWNRIAQSAWICADPGVQYDTTINDWHTCPNSGRINASNPCSEYMFLDDTACNLASINLVKFELDPKGDEYHRRFDFDGFGYVTKLLTIVLEITVHMAQFPSERIAELSYKFRTLGLGYANLGCLLMRGGMPYDSEDGRAFAAYITAVMHGIAYLTSAEMAEHFGAFSDFEINRDPMLRVIKNHRRAILQEECIGVSVQPIFLNQANASRSDIKYLVNLWNNVVELGEKHGFRNAQVTLLAPTGTIALEMDCDTTGIEPDFALVKYKKLQGGGYMKIVNNSVSVALGNLGYNPHQIKEIVEYIIGTGDISRCNYVNTANLLIAGFTQEDIQRVNQSLPSAFSLVAAFSPWNLGEDLYRRMNVPEGGNILEALGFTHEQIEEDNLISCGYMCIEGAPYLKEEHLPIFDCANKNGNHGQRYISVEGHVLMMAAVQPFLSGAISKTVNLPEECTISDCEKVYMLGWECGLKAIALFRNNSKLSSAMYSGSTGEISAKKKKKFGHEPTKRGIKEALPDQRRGYTQRATIGNDSEKGKIYHTTEENSKGEFRGMYVNGFDAYGPTVKNLLNCFAKAVSIGLQHGVPVETMVRQFLNTNFPPHGIVTGHKYIRFANSIVDYLVRDIGINYCDMSFLGQIKYDEDGDDVDYKRKKLENPAREHAKEHAKEHLAEIDYKELGYTGDVCTNCGGMRMVKDGACAYCADCGANTGCG